MFGPADLVLGLCVAVGRDFLARHIGEHTAKLPPGNSHTTVSGVERRRQQNPNPGENLMSFDIVGDDDDYGAIGLDPQFVGGDDLSYLNSLVSGELDALISGDGTSEIIGAASGKRAQDAKKAAALKQLAMRSAGAVIKRGLDRRRRYPLGVVPTTITSGDTETIPTTPQNLFRPERLVIPSDIAFDVGVTDVKVGNQSQFVETSEVPGSLFSEVAINTGVTFDTAEIGNQISVQIRNKSLSDVEFVAGFVGTIAK
jgi:hypothetical protein